MLDKAPVRTAVSADLTGHHTPTSADPIRDERNAEDFSQAKASEDASRVDLLRLLTGLRHLPASTEPGRVFSDLAGVCVPALCDELVITIEEAGGHRYRIRQPAAPRSSAAGTANTGAGQSFSAATTSGPPTPDVPEPVGPVRVTVHMVRTTVTSVPGGGPRYTATLLCRWHTGYLPTDADVALVGVLAEHAAGVVHRERTLDRLTDQTTARQVGVALDEAQRIAAATGVLMAMHHLTMAQARQLLDRASDRTHRSLQRVADTVLNSGSLTEHSGSLTEPPAAEPS